MSGGWRGDPDRAPACGGCAGRGAHKRWCPARVGPRAAKLGTTADDTEALADRVGSSHPGVANILYGAAESLRAEAAAAADDWRRSN